MITLRSKITQELLNYFFLNPEAKLYVNEICRKLKLDKRNLVKKLREFEKDGILIVDSIGNMKFYTLNKKYPLYDTFKEIIRRITGVKIELQRIVEANEKIQKAYIYGSYADNTMDSHSDIDVLIIGDHSIIELQKHINKIQSSIDREINIIHMDKNEFNNRIKNKDPFLTHIFNNKYIILKNEI